MSKFFDDVDDSDEETISSVDESEQGDLGSDNGDSECEIDPKWFLKDDDGDDSDDEEVLHISKDAKSLKELEDLSGQMDIEISNNYWTRGYQSFEKLRKKAEEYAAKKGGYRPAVFLAALRALQEATDIQLAREECEKKEDHVHFGKLGRLTLECLETYKADLERQKRIDDGLEEAQEVPQDDEPEEKGEDWSKEGMLAMIANIHTNKLKTQNKILRGVISHALPLGLHSLVITANSQLASNTLEDGAHQVSHIAFKQWKAAFDLTLKTYALCVSHGLNVTEGIIASKITEKNTAVVPFSAQVESLYERYIQALQFNHTDTMAHLPRVQEEQPLLEFCVKLLDFYEARGTKKAILKISLIIEDIMYNRTVQQHEAICDFYTNDKNFKLEGLAKNKDLFDKVHNIVVTKGEDTQQTMSILRYAFNLAVNNKYHAARDLILQADLANTEYLTTDLQVAGNRAVAQLGLCAFRNGLFFEANTILNDLCSRTLQQMKILLGQEIAFVRDNAAKELRLRQRLIPAHRHLVADLIEAAALVSSMLISVVSEAKKPFERGNRPTYLAKLFTQQSMAVISGAPANLKESIYHSYQAIEKGTVVQGGQDSKLPIFTSEVWNSLGGNKDAVFASVELEIKVSALKVFLIKNGASYNSLSVDHLSTKFALEASKVRSVVSQLLLDRDHVIIGYWDSEEKFLTIERGNSSKLHHLADHGADRLAQLAGGAPSRYDRRGPKRAYRARQ